MDVARAQRDIRHAYVGGGPGTFVSALVWFGAALVERQSGVAAAFAALFFGGFLIFPLGVLISRFLFRRPAEAADNPLRHIALESTVPMVGGLFAAWLLIPHRPAFVFPLAAMAVGAHYFAFQTLYGDVRFWLLGALLTAIGVGGIFAPGTIPAGPIPAVAMVEITFAVWLTWGPKPAV